MEAKKFGEGSRAHQISPAKRYTPKNNNPGPGEYAHERGDSVTKDRTPNTHIPPPREEIMFEATVGPGEYETFEY
jgi:hypothetical protein